MSGLHLSTILGQFENKYKVGCYLLIEVWFGTEAQSSFEFALIWRHCIQLKRGAAISSFGFQLKYFWNSLILSFSFIYTLVRGGSQNN
jgi:hypothetical protein